MHLLAQADPVSVWAVFDAFFSHVEDALALLLSAPNRDMLTIQIVAIAGLSEAIGQSVVLFANRVRPSRFLLSLLVAILLFVIGFFLWAGSLWLIMSYLLDVPMEWPMIAGAVAISYIPLVLAFLGFLPYAGQPILQLLYFISFYYLVTLLIRVSPLNFGNSFVVAAIGLVLVLLIRATVGRVITRVAYRMLGVAAGTPLKFDLNDAVSSFADPDENQDRRENQRREG